MKKTIICPDLIISTFVNLVSCQLEYFSQDKTENNRIFKKSFSMVDNAQSIALFSDLLNNQHKN